MRQQVKMCKVIRQTTDKDRIAINKILKTLTITETNIQNIQCVDQIQNFL